MPHITAASLPSHSCLIPTTFCQVLGFNVSSLPWNLYLFLCSIRTINRHYILPSCAHRRTMDAQGKALSSSTSSPDSHCLPLPLPPDFPFLPSSPNYYFQSMARLSCSTPLSQTRKSVLGPFSGIIRHTKRSLYHTRAFACSSFFLSVVSRCFILLIPVPEIARPNLFTPI